LLDLEDRMRLRRGAKQTAPESAPASQATETAPPQPPPAPQHPDSLVYELLANVALRDLTVIERILSVISDVERGEQDPERLAFYYALDHDVTRLRRSAENALVLAGAQAPMGRAEPMTLLDVARAAASESSDYTRVSVGQLPPVAVGPAVADDLAHTLAELMDNALSVSPSRALVTVSGARAGGGILVSVEDEGIGIPPELLPELNTRLTGPLLLDVPSTRQMGLYVVAHLARRHGIYVQLQSRRQLGSAAVAFLPDRLLLDGAAASGTAALAPAPPVAARMPTPPQISRPMHVPPPAQHQAQPAAQRPRRGYQSPDGPAGRPPAAPSPDRAPASAPAHARVPAQSQAEPWTQPPQAQPRPQQPQPWQPGPVPNAPGAVGHPPVGQEPRWDSQDPYDLARPQPYPDPAGSGYAEQPAPATPLAPPVPLTPPAPAAPAPFAPPPSAPAVPPPVAPATVDRWAPSPEEREQPTAFTDQGLPRRTRPSTPRTSTPRPAPREAKPADPDSVLADLDAFAAGSAAADALGPPPAGNGAPAAGGFAGPVGRAAEPPRNPAPLLLTDPAQEEF
jgi:Histidine kinase-, DNA gyrase B-, and HSP90-like ATPase